MSELLTIRDTIRDFLRKFDEITTPLLRFIAALVMFNSINTLFGYSDLFDKGMVTFLLALISALVSGPVVVFVGGLVVLMNTFSISTEVALVTLVLFICIYGTYMRMFMHCGWVLALVPILYLYNLEFAAPVIVVIFAGFSGIIPAAFGVLLYYFSIAVKDVNSILATATDETEFNAMSYIIDNVIKNKELLGIAAAMGAAIAIGYVVYMLPVDYAWYIGIGVTGLATIICVPVVTGVLGTPSVAMGGVILGAILGVLIGVLAQFAKGLLNYAHKENVQFEDDDYYYYVKAVPKYKSSKKKAKRGNEDMEEAVAQNVAAAGNKADNIANNMNMQNNPNRMDRANTNQKTRM